MIFGLSLGSIYKLIPDDNKNEAITFIRKTLKNKINAIEILIPKNNLQDFKLSNENYEWVNSLKYVSYHMLNQNCLNEEIDTINKIYHINHIICHIDKINNILYTNDFSTFSYKFLYENIDTCIQDNNFTGIDNICFDIAHAMRFGIKYFEKFIIENENNFKQIHLSNFDKECHTPFHNTKKGIENFKFIKSIFDMKKYPIIVESVCENLNELKNEITYIKEQLCN